MGRTGKVWLGTFAAPLPLVIVTLVIVALTVGISETALGFIVIGYLVVLIPLAVSYGILRLTSWRGIGAYAGVMFAVTFLPMLGIYQFLEFTPDSRITVEFDDGVERNVNLAMLGVILSGVVGLLNSAGMAIFWFFAIRACRNTPET